MYNNYYWKKQKHPSQYCGQLALSIILHKKLSDTIKIFGHDKSTSAQDLINILHMFKIKCESKLRRKRLSNLAIGALKRDKYYSDHWVVVWKNKIFDGNLGLKSGKVLWNKNWRIVSYLNIYS